MRKRIIGIFLTVILVVSMTACQQTKPEGNSSGYCGTVEGVAFELPDLGSRVELHTQQQNDFLAEAKKNNNYDYIAMYAQGTMEASRPIPVSLSWTASGTRPIDGDSVNISKHLLLDYIYSNFGTIGGSRSTDAILNDYIPLLENAKGDNLSEKIYNYLAENGVSTKDMDAVIAIMKEK
ncbi:MAG: hypothetical protein IKW10_05090 [Oscillospiraceae bacterium]|nr:hypothetical protein [Oscillospiraceae bacterium]